MRVIVRSKVSEKMYPSIAFACKDMGMTYYRLRREYEVIRVREKGYWDNTPLEHLRRLGAERKGTHLGFQEYAFINE